MCEPCMSPLCLGCANASCLWPSRQSHCACWLVLAGFLLDLADGAVARQLNACSALGESPKTSGWVPLSHSVPRGGSSRLIS